MGYHYLYGLTQYELTVQIVDVNGDVITDANLIYGTVEPNGVTSHVGGRVVVLDANADAGYRAKWTGTADDTSFDRYNMVTMDGDKTVTVEFELIPIYEFKMSVVSGSGVVGLSDPNDPLLVDYNSVTDTYHFYAGTIAMTADPCSGYRLRSWSETDDDLSKELTNYVTLAGNTEVEVDFELIRTILLWDEYNRNIQTAIDAVETGDGDTILLQIPNNLESVIYTIDDPEGIDFKGKAITIKSEYQDKSDPDIIANTIIDCRGLGRAFIFQNGEDANTVIDGITIINGFTAGAYGAGGFVTTLPNDANIVDANFIGGSDATGDGYGGALYIGSGTGPSILNCVIRDCNVAGGVGGRGADGRPGYLSDGSIEGSFGSRGRDVAREGTGWDGGDGGNGYGNGYGGAIYCGPDSDPIIENCTLINNIATGGIGGDGGDGGRAFPGSGGNESSGGDGGGGNGDGYGGCIYVDADAAPRIDSVIIENMVNRGIGGKGGERGYGAPYEPPEPRSWPGSDGWTAGTAYGSGAYCASGSNANFDNSAFIKNNNLFSNGGAIYYESGIVNQLTNCSFTSNTTVGSGGAISIQSGSELAFNECSFGGNKADANGGAISCVGQVDDLVVLDINNCTFGGNTGVLGGSIYADYFDANIIDGYFNRNTAENGGGLYLVNGGVVSITGGAIMNNIATGDPDPNVEESTGRGGGIMVRDCSPVISNCIISDNSANDQGGGILFRGSSANPTYPIVENCLLTGNSADVAGGGISSRIYALPVIANCTFSDNKVIGSDLGGGIYCEYYASAIVVDSIFNQCRDVAVYEGVNCDIDMSFCLFYYNRDGDFYDSNDDANAVLYQTYDVNNPNDPNLAELAALNSATGGDNKNKAGDPMFVSGELGDYYLDQVDSNAVDQGSVLASAVGMDIYTTDPDMSFVPDTGQVDIGYHYLNHQLLSKFDLTVSVADDGHGTVVVKWPIPEPNDYNAVTDTYTYYGGMLVELEATPDTGFRVGEWVGGTIDDSSKLNTNYVVIGPINKDIVVDFEQPRTILAFSDEYPSLQHAIDEADDGDIVMIPGETYTNNDETDLYHIYIWDKGVTITSPSPGDPNYAVVILDGFNFDIRTGNGAETVIDGITFRNSYRSASLWLNRFDWWDWGEGEYRYSLGGNAMYIKDCSPKIRNCVFKDCTIGPFGTMPKAPGCSGIVPPHDGYNGDNVAGAAVYIYNGSPEFLHCEFKDNSATGQDGQEGSDGCTTLGHPEGWDGGWAGYAYGGAVYCGYDSDAYFLDCSFVNNTATGGNGGYGGDTDSPPTNGGRGGNWEESPSEEDPDSGHYEFWWWDKWEWGPYLDYWKYSGYGGAVYLEKNSSAKFVGCNFDNNRTYGGVSGQGGEYWPNPNRPMDIENFGGTIYAGGNSTLEMIDCDVTDSYADTSTQAIPHDYIVSFGGAICVEDGSKLIMKDSSISGSQACEGGAIYWSNAAVTIEDSNITDNVAYHGGGLFSIDSAGADEVSTISGCYIAENEAFAVQALYLDPCDANLSSIPENISGQGGGYMCFSTTAEISDTVFSGNQSSGSGGAIYFGGADQNDYSTPVLDNCLVTGNTAWYDGGGISTNWYSEPFISSCTIADNRVTSIKGSGGGLSNSSYSYTQVIDSIIWGNSATNGAQIGLIGGGPYTPRPGQVDVIFSDVDVSQPDPNDRARSLDLVFCIDTTGSMYEPMEAVKTSVVEIIGGITDTFDDYRVAVVTFEDFNEPNDDPNYNYGGPNDSPYEDIVGFTSDVNLLTTGVNSMELGFGADWRESVYAGLMHCIDHSSLAARLGGDLHGGDPTHTGPGIWRSGDDVARVIILIGDAPPHDPEPFTDYVFRDVVEAALSGNAPKIIFSIVTGYGIGNDMVETPLGDLADATGGMMLTATDSDEVVSSIVEAIEMSVMLKKNIFVDTNCILDLWDANSNSWDANSNNISDDPLFIGGYYLSQIDAGQLVDSNCVNAGSVLASELGFSELYTTRTSAAPDDGQVDMGYHYGLSDVVEYSLSFSAVEVVDPCFVGSQPIVIYPVIDPLDPNDPNGTWSQYVTVPLQVSSPPAGYEVVWSGTDDDSIIEPNNTVTMDGDKNVAVTFARSHYELTVGVIGEGGG
ncbi:hypothetical protein ACFL3G_11095, partial [Planctomycetota bacterium]